MRTKRTRDVPPILRRQPSPPRRRQPPHIFIVKDHLRFRHGRSSRYQKRSNLLLVLFAGEGFMGCPQGASVSPAAYVQVGAIAEKEFYGRRVAVVGGGGESAAVLAASDVDVGGFVEEERGESVGGGGCAGGLEGAAVLVADGR